MLNGKIALGPPCRVHHSAVFAAANFALAHDIFSGGVFSGCGVCHAVPAPSRQTLLPGLAKLALYPLVFGNPLLAQPLSIAAGSQL